MRVSLETPVSVLRGMSLRGMWHLFWVEVDKLPWNMLGQCKAMEASSDCSLDNFFKLILCMAAKLT